MELACADKDDSKKSAEEDKSDDHLDEGDT